MPRKLTPSERFFHEWAGYSYGPGETKAQGRRRGAIALAAAERAARDAGCYWDWSEDLDGYPPRRKHNGEWGYWHDPGDGDLMRVEISESCTLLDAHNRVLASLHGIWDASSEYRRVVQAELALEADLATETAKDGAA